MGDDAAVDGELVDGSIVQLCGIPLRPQRSELAERILPVCAVAVGEGEGLACADLDGVKVAVCRDAVAVQAEVDIIAANPLFIQRHSIRQIVAAVPGNLRQACDAVPQHAVVRGISAALAADRVLMRRAEVQIQRIAVALHAVGVVVVMFVGIESIRVAVGQRDIFARLGKGNRTFCRGHRLRRQTEVAEV